MGLFPELDALPTSTAAAPNGRGGKEDKVEASALALCLLERALRLDRNGGRPGWPTRLTRAERGADYLELHFAGGTADGLVLRVLPRRPGPSERTRLGTAHLWFEYRLATSTRAPAMVTELPVLWSRVRFETLAGFVGAAAPAEVRPYPSAEVPAALEVPEPDGTNTMGAPGDGELRYGGEAARARFEKALSLAQISGREGPVSRVRYVAEGAAGIEIELAEGALDGFRLRIYPRLLEGPYIRTAHFSVEYSWKGGRPASPAERALAEYIRARWDAVPYETLVRVVRADPGEPPGDPEPEADESQAESGEGAPERSPHVYRYGKGGAVAAFYAVNELERSRGYEFRGRVADVTHSELECRFGYPATDDGTAHFFVFPRQEACSSHSPAARRAAVAVSDIEDMDTIRSGVPRLLDMLTDAEGKDETQLLVLSASCTPRVTGDDLEGVAEQVARATGTRVVVPRHEVNPHVSVLLGELDRGLPAHGSDALPLVNLVGFPRLPGRAALERHIEHGGIGLNATLLPEIDPDVLDRYRAASTQVLCRLHGSHPELERVYERLSALPGMATLEVAAPFGMAASREMLMRLHEHYRVLRGKVSRLPAIVARYEAPWARIVEAAEPYWIGFVLDDVSLDGLERTQGDTGVPVMGFVAELGFGLDVLLTGPEHRRAALRERVAAEVPGARLRFSELGAGETLESALRASKAAAFYSELFFDRRLSRAGKSRIGPADFAMGPDGALETGQRLLAAVRTSYYRTYGAVLREVGGVGGVDGR